MEKSNPILKERYENLSLFELAMISLWIKELCKMAHKHGALFHTDAVQAVGHVNINVKELGIDFLSASAHKFNGPRGIGFLCVRKAIIHPFIEGGSQEKGKRAGTENVAAAVGMAKALKK